MRALIAVLPRKAEINHEHLAGSWANAHDEILWLDIAVDEIFFVHVFEARQHLIGQHQDRLQRQPTVAFHKQILERFPKEVDDQNVVDALATMPEKSRDSNTALENLINFRFIDQLGRFGPDGLQFDRDRAVGLDLFPAVDFAEVPGANFAAEAESASDNSIHLGERSIVQPF
jgi:hypothetical protein